ncbi:unnamed protein product [Didymodactylos carnosus]|uniref:Uncharacterized protein n=1 Tax=Didymodactylos carnosus TaxID=1234261 RepID=A0A813QLE2_9BILA|nr:unnamed protein product [Didymodactylos carnosus]CAF0779825.1 unnamed protein product [Didymodactylos carnosus]CAF3551945.1 unnamed protein product [Didymodactylos carnosus]CAF3561287.1 unnamed protein product [Didymodactylos carnosus]
MANIEGPKSLMDEMIHENRNFGGGGSEGRPSRFGTNDDTSSRGNSRGRGSYNGSRGGRFGGRGNFQPRGGGGYQHDRLYRGNNNNNNDIASEENLTSVDNGRKMSAGNSVPPSLLGLNFAPRHSSNYSNDPNSFQNKNNTFPDRGGRSRFSNPRGGFGGDINRFPARQTSFDDNKQQQFNDNFRQQQHPLLDDDNNMHKSQKLVPQDKKQISQNPLQPTPSRGNNDRLNMGKMIKTYTPDHQQHYQTDNRRHDRRQENSRKEYDRSSRDRNSRTDRSRSPPTRNDRNDRQFGMRGGRGGAGRGNRGGFMNKREEERSNDNNGRGHKSRFGSDDHGFKGPDYDHRSSSQHDNREHGENDGRGPHFPGAGYRNSSENRSNPQYGNMQQRQHPSNFPSQSRPDYNSMQQNYHQQGGMGNEQRSNDRLNRSNNPQGSNTNSGRRQSRFTDRQTEDYDDDNKPLRKPEFQLPVATTTTPLYLPNQSTNTATYSHARPAPNQSFPQQQQQQQQQQQLPLMQSQINPQFQTTSPNFTQQSTQNQSNISSYQQASQPQQQFGGVQGYNWPSGTSLLSTPTQPNQVASHSMIAMQQPNPYGQQQQLQSVNPFGQYGITSNLQQTPISTPIAASQPYQNQQTPQAGQQAISTMGGTTAPAMDGVQQQQWAQYCQQYWNYVQQQQAALGTAPVPPPEQAVALQQQSQATGHNYSSLSAQQQPQSTSLPAVKQTSIAMAPTVASQDTSVTSGSTNVENPWSQYLHQQWSQFYMQQPNASTSTAASSQPAGDSSNTTVQQQASLSQTPSTASAIPNYLSQLNQQQQPQQQGGNSNAWENWFNQA